MAESQITHTLVRQTGMTASFVNQNFRDVQQFVNTETVHRDGSGVAAALTAGLSWQPWTPVLTAPITNPTLGSGSVIVGEFIKLGDLVVATGRIVWGSSGVNAGSGIYEISLPVPCVTLDSVAGNALLVDSGTTLRTGVLYAVTTTKMAIAVDAGVVANNVPWTWAANDEIRWHVIYRAG